MVKCSFCGGIVLEGRGKMFVRNDGKIFYYCNSKCQKNWRLGREGKHIKWTDTSRKEREKEGPKQKENPAHPAGGKDTKKQ
jgi:large subunit ribosomal protein L24e